MKKYFIASLCKNGILGGGISADSDALTFHTGKLSVPDAYRRIEMKYRDIRAVESGRMFIFPTVTLKLHGGGEYEFVVFARKQFVNLLKEMVADA